MLEHVNLTVTDPAATASMLCELFDWQIRWQGTAKNGGFTVHVGAQDNYLAVYTHPQSKAGADDTYAVAGGLNHIGVLVEDFETATQRVRDRGFETYNFGEYEPGRRFYFRDGDGIEFEVVSYD
jgi:catechol 2,3-dioxygenase-like lactoylglutathione lyase family enzyme